MIALQCLAIIASQDSPPISGSYSLSAPSSVMTSETWFCVCDTVVPSGAECSTLTYFLHFEIHKDEEEPFWDTWGLYAIQKPSAYKTKFDQNAAFFICNLLPRVTFILYSRAEQLTDTVWPIQYLPFELLWKKSVSSWFSWSEWRTNNPVLGATS